MALDVFQSSRFIHFKQSFFVYSDFHFFALIKCRLLLGLFLFVFWVPLKSFGQIEENLVKITVPIFDQKETRSGFVIGRDNNEITIATAGHELESLKSTDSLIANLLFNQRRNGEVDNVAMRLKIIDFIYDTDLDLAFIKVDLESRAKSLIFQKIKYRDDERLKRNSKVVIYSYPRSLSTRDVELLKIKDPAYENANQFLVTGFRNLEPGDSGGMILNKGKTRFLGMPINVGKAGGICLSVKAITSAVEGGRLPVTRNLLTRNRFSTKVKRTGYIGIGFIAIALSARILSDRTYHDYWTDGQLLTPSQFEEEYGRTLKEQYNLANLENNVAYGSATLGIGFLTWAVLQHLKEEKEDDAVKRSFLSINFMGTVISPRIKLTYTFHNRKRESSHSK